MTTRWAAGAASWTIARTAAGARTPAIPAAWSAGGTATRWMSESLGPGPSPRLPPWKLPVVQPWMFPVVQLWMLSRRPTPPLERSARWDRGDASASCFYAYLLRLSDGSFYAGQTREIRERLMEHRDGAARYTSGRNPSWSGS